MPRITPFSIGQIWRSSGRMNLYTSNPYANMGYFWEIVGKGKTADSKIVRMIYDPHGPNIHGSGDRRDPIKEYEFKHSHIKKYAIPFSINKFDLCRNFDEKLQAILQKRREIVRDTRGMLDLEIDKRLTIDAWEEWGEYHQIIMGKKAWHEMHKDDLWYKREILAA